MNNLEFAEKLSKALTDPNCSIWRNEPIEGEDFDEWLALWEENDDEWHEYYLAHSDRNTEEDYNLSALAFIGKSIKFFIEKGYLTK